MAEYIEREVAMDAIRRAFSDQECDCEVMPDVFAALQDAPAADVAQVVHGRWEEVIEKRIYGNRWLRCSNCKSRNGTAIKFNYCPNCGAKMDGGDKNAG